MRRHFDPVLVTRLILRDPEQRILSQQQMAASGCAMYIVIIAAVALPASAADVCVEPRAILAAASDIRDHWSVTLEHLERQISEVRRWLEEAREHVNAKQLKLRECIFSTPTNTNSATSDSSFYSLPNSERSEPAGGLPSI